MPSPVLLTLMLFAGLAAPASAATVAVVDHTFQPSPGTDVTTSGVRFAALSGEVNRVTVTLAEKVVTVNDAGAPVTAGRGCEVVDAHTATCSVDPSSTFDLPRVALGDGDDTATVTGHGAPGGGGDDAAVDGGPGADTVTDPAGGVDGGRGDDTLAGQSVLGGPGADRITATQIGQGGAGDDVLSGDGAENSLYGDRGKDILRAGAGDDIVEGGAGVDLLKGGDGDDSMLAGDDLYVDRVDCGAGTDVLSDNVGVRAPATRCEQTKRARFAGFLSPGDEATVSGARMTVNFLCGDVCPGARARLRYVVPHQGVRKVGVSPVVPVGQFEGARFHLSRTLRRQLALGPVAFRVTLSTSGPRGLSETERFRVDAAG